MPERLRSLRFKLTATFILIFGLLQAGLWGAVDALRTGYLRSSFDQRLIEQAQTAVEVVDADLRKGRSLRDVDNLNRLFQPLERAEYFLELRGADGTVVYSSANLRGHELPFVPFLREGVALDHGLMQDDGIHPNEKAQPRMVEMVWSELLPLLKK